MNVLLLLVVNTSGVIFHRVRRVGFGRVPEVASFGPLTSLLVGSECFLAGAGELLAPGFSLPWACRGTFRARLGVAATCHCFWGLSGGGQEVHCSRTDELKMILPVQFLMQQVLPINASMCLHRSSRTENLGPDEVKHLCTWHMLPCT